ncbi:MAG: Holliday junction resolvase-like protein [archaeon]
MDIIIIILIVIVFIVGFWLGKMLTHVEWKLKLPGLRKEAVEKSRSVLTGNFSEQLAPYLPDFPFSPTECRFLGKPIDLIVFKGMDEKEPNEVVFVEIKTGKSNLSSSERKLRDIIKDKKVSWYEYRPSSSQEQSSQQR